MTFPLADAALDLLASFRDDPAELVMLQALQQLVQRRIAEIGASRVRPPYGAFGPGHEAPEREPANPFE